ncbi:MAG: amino acid adenylation domain-containing protein [Moorea sp. SIOASIH]|uniref:amino acid adenylation domain-containing protein n=1 Tax=Moorena sp. SIOASIH TaxID=2607817 RepID=UPI0013B8E828|nr:amino acid adenylation domain-containing protein [Moorena sp. SIOASIH]NEO39726.1 amino acid adenylation domain-containing protein [Moorena sp. SIOASIH]
MNLVDFLRELSIKGWKLWVQEEEIRYHAPKYEPINSVLAQLKQYKTEILQLLRDYIHWQKQMAASAQGEKHWNYWHRKLTGDLPVLNLPTDRPRPPVQTDNSYSYSFRLSANLTQKLNIIAQKQETTLYSVLLATFDILLYRYTSEPDILVGSLLLGRSKPELANIVGYFVNPVVMRADLSGNPTFEGFLDQVHKTVLEAITHQDYPFALLVNKLQPQRDPSYAPIFQVSFNLEPDQQSHAVQRLLRNETEADTAQEKLKLKPGKIPLQEGLFDLALDMVEGSSSVEGTFKYNTDLFDGATIERMAGHFQNLLSGCVENPQQSVAELPLLSQAERHQLLVEWNDTEKEYPQDQCIHQLFEEQVEKTPDAVAVVFEDEQLTYQQLNQRANQLARHLQSLGVGPEVLVGIGVERSVGMVVGLLGILKAGGAYVPLDPNYPAERLSYMLSDSGVEVLVTQQSLLESWPGNRAKVICLDHDWGFIEQYSGENLDVEIFSDNLAYVIYTSGSTGQPKGVAIVHRSVVNFSEGLHQTIYQEIPNSPLRVSLNGSLSFDGSVKQFVQLLHGYTVDIVPTMVRFDGDALLSYLQHHRIDVFDCTPSQLELLVSAGLLSGDNVPKYILVAGEKVTLDLWQALSQRRDLNFFNLYGPTECTVDTTVCPLRICHHKQLIGRPIANTQIYILDSNLQPVPIGVPGEIYIGGDGLARGYLNRPELTAEKFISNPFSDYGEKLYKTGDFARYLPDGNLEFLGRIDNQVKIRGFRIELGEIESVINTHPQIQKAVVIAREDNPGNKRLVAYVVNGEKSISISQLRGFVKQKLPEYMVPNAFVTLDTLPLTPNGKVDRRALPVPDGAISREIEYVAPSTPTQEIIANIFADVLKVKNVGIKDNFFELGGHSLLATQLTSRLKQAFSVDIPLRVIFESPNVAQLEQALTQQHTASSLLNLPPIQPRGKIFPIPLSFAQERLWLHGRIEGERDLHTICFFARLKGNLDINALQQALSEIVRRHEVLRTNFKSEDGKLVQIIHPEADIKIHVVDLQQLEGRECKKTLRQHIQQQGTTPFNLESSPLIKCSLLKLDVAESVLLMPIHHIIFDGWSRNLFNQELCSLYQAFIQGEPSLLSELTIQYADFALWQRQFMSPSVLKNQLNYWKQQLDGAPALLPMPIDRPRPKVKTYNGDLYKSCLNSNLTQKLKTLAKKTNTTLFMILYGALATLLYRYSGQSDILISTLVANRNYSDTESLIGLFQNVLLLRAFLEDELTFEKLLVQVKETTLTAYENQDIPFEQVMKALQVKNYSLDYASMLQVMLILQNMPMDKLAIPGIKISPFRKEYETSLLDLTLFITEVEQELRCEWEYNTDLFNESTIERMTSHFQNLLSGIVENSQVSVSELPLLSKAQRHQLLGNCQN